MIYISFKNEVNVCDSDALWNDISSHFLYVTIFLQGNDLMRDNCYFIGCWASHMNNKYIH